jgi:hypothetical protein
MARPVAIVTVGRGPATAVGAVPAGGIGDRRGDERRGEKERRDEGVGLHRVLPVTTRAQRGST